MGNAPELSVVEGQPRRFGFVVVDSGGDVDIGGTVTAFRKAYPRRAKDEIELVIPLAVEVPDYVNVLASMGEVDTDARLLFGLARKLKAIAAPNWRGEKGGEYFAAYALVFRDVLRYRECLPEPEDSDIDWDDDDEVLVRFEATWSKVLFAEGENVLVAACNFASEGMLKLDHVTNRNLRMLLGIAYYLQNKQGPKAIMLPQERVGALLGVSAAHVGELIHVLVTRKMLHVVSDKYSAASRVAKKYKLIAKIERRGE